MGVNDCFKVPACERNCCFRCSDDAEKRQNNVGAVRLMNEAMKKAAFAALGFFYFWFFFAVLMEEISITRRLLHISSTVKKVSIFCVLLLF